MKAPVAFFLLAAALRAQPQWPPPPAKPRLSFLRELDGRQHHPSASRWQKWAALALGLEGPGRGSNQPRLRQPTGLWFQEGVLYVADPASAAVWRYDTERESASWLGQGLLRSPSGVAVAPDGRIFVADPRLGRVLIFDPNGKALGELSGDPEGLGRPAALALGAGRLYVSDPGRHRISAYGLEGIFIQSFGMRGTAPGQFNFPTFLSLDRRGRLWVCDSGNFRLQWFSRDGRYLGQLGSSGNRPGYLARPKGLALDSEDHVYTLDGALDALQVFDESGRFLLFVGQAGSAPGQFNLPAGAFMDDSDRLFVADAQNSRVQIFQYLKESRP